MSQTDLAELRRLWEAATKGEWAVEPVDAIGRAVLRRGERRMFPIPANDAAFMAAAHNALPALLDELEAAREEVSELKSERDAALLILKIDGHATEYALGLLDARDRRMKLIGAAEELELVAGEWSKRGRERRFHAQELLERAAKLRQEAKGK